MTGFSDFYIRRANLEAVRRINMKLPTSRNENIVVQRLRDEMMIYDLTIDKAYCLNETSAIIYQNCNGATTFDELKSRYKLTDELIYLTLDKLRGENLLDENESYASPLAGVSRREVIRRAGLGSLAALPVISALVAPPAANAASGFAPGSRSLRQTCNTSTDCAGGAPNCTRTPSNSPQRICCIGTDSRYDTGGLVNSCTGGACSSQTFACQSDAGSFCCSGSAQASCTGNSCACRCL